MKTKIAATALCLAILVGAVLFAVRTPAAIEVRTLQSQEYATIRWGGREFTHVVRPNGEVEMLGALFAPVPKQERVDERARLMTIAANALAKEGYEFAGMTADQILMKRQLAR